jgi:DNA-binding CsgD family transcriptional regulator
VVEVLAMRKDQVTTTPWTDRPERAATFRELTRVLCKPDHYERAVDDAALLLARALRAACLVALVTPDGRRMHGVALRHYDKQADTALEAILGAPFPIPPLTAKVLETGESLRVERATRAQLDAAPSIFQPFFEAVNASSFVGVPLLAPAGHLGLLSIVRGEADGIFDVEDAAFIEDVAKPLALRIEHGQFAERLEPRELAGGDEVLTRRETEILALLAKGHTNREIADELVLSVRTVDWHRAKIQAKLGVQSRSDLFRLAVDRGLVG